MNRWLNRAANLFLMLLCSECLLALIRDSFHLTAGPETGWRLALLCALLWLAAFFRRGFLPGISAAVGIMWYLIRYREENLSQEMLDILRAVRTAWINGIWNKNPGSAFQASVESHALALLLLLFFAAAYLAAVLSSENCRVNLSLLLTLPLVALCLVVNRDPPALPLLGMGLFWMGLIIGGDSYRPHDAAGQAVLLTVLPCLAVLGLALLFNRPSDYVAEDRALMLSRRIERLSSAISSFWDSRPGMPQVFQGLGRRSDALSGWDQGQDGLDLTQPYDFSAGAHEILTLRSSFDGSLYLRGRSLGSYTGTGWSEAEEQADFQALNYAAYSVAMAGFTGSGTVQTCSFEVETDREYDFLYLPYFTVSSPSGDVSVPADAKTVYGGQYLLLTGGSPGALPDSLQWEELQYRSFVREYYTRLPENTRNALADIARINGLNAADRDILAKVADYVCRGSTYDLRVGPYPDSDYALYFLLHARRGYCIHYATAACCLYRALGIPARVCEGFLTMSQSGRETVVRAADAHTWVEVWLDGMGWIPVEVTFGSSAAEGDAADSPLLDVESTRTEDAADRDDFLPENRETGSTSDRTEIAPDGSGIEADEASDTKDTDAGDGSSGREKDGVKIDDAEENPPGDKLQSPEDDRKETHDDAENESGTRNRSRRDLVLPVLLAVPAAVALAVAGRYAFVRKRLRRWLAEPDGRLRAVYQYRQAQRVLRFGGEMPEAVLTAAEKASFSPHNISEEELRRSLEALNRLTDQVQSGLGPLRRLIFRYHLGL